SAIPVLRGRRDGRAFATFLVTYAVGRFAIELFRGDQDRGQVLGLSTAQWVSIAIVAALFAVWASRRVGSMTKVSCHAEIGHDKRCS
ncbi:MAG TPA: prolipoprotein diacylglyceryl transferase family protein, partial [Polyangia bacterium]|nr:prolipoprotein diacylglyceryl transferase family protein [Polyangia bacterium]